jgi:YidC/Oxa1 family membrane protein insertase
MDRKSIIVLALSFLLLAFWPMVMSYLGYGSKPTPHPNDAAPGATNQLAGTNAGTLPPSTTPVAAPPTTAVLVPPGTPEELLTIESDDARYVFTSHGGGLKEVELKRYPETVACGRKSRAATNQLAALNATAALPVMAALGGAEVQGDGVFKLTKTASGARAEKTLTNGLHWVKEFTLRSNYLVATTVRWENRSAQPVTLPARQWVVGTATPLGLTDDATYMGAYWFNGQRAEHTDRGYFSETSFCMPRTPPAEYRQGQSNVLWAAVHNQFFALGVITANRAQEVVVLKTNLPPPTAADLAENPKAVKKPFGFRADLVFPPATLAPNQAAERQFHIYAGPREYRTLSKVAAQFKNEFDLVMGFDAGFGGAFFGFFAKTLLLSMNGLHSVGLGYGLAIIVITVIVKLLFWPLTNASTKSMKRMAALQPQMKALQERYKDDPAKMNKKLMEFMKEHKVSPLGGCLPMLLQIPVFFGFYKMILSAIELRGARFLWACDLSKSDTIFVLPGLAFPVNPLPLLMGATMLWQARLTPPSPGMDPMQQKIMKYMPLMFLFILYNFSAGLTLYWTVQNLLTIAQMKLTKAKDATTAPAPAPVPKPVAPALPPRKKKR